MTAYKLGKTRNDIYLYSFSTDRIFSYRAFVTDYSDTYTANWSSQEIFGRMDPIYNYKNTVRKISLAFDVPSFSLQEAKENAESADIFIKSLYPVYNIENNGEGAATIGSPPLFRVKFANLIKKFSSVEADALTANPVADGLLGYIDNFSFKPSLESGFLEDPDVPSDIKLYPKLYKVNFNFFVIHEHPLGQTVENGNHIDRLKNDKNLPFSHGYDRSTTDNIEEKRNEIKTAIQSSIQNSSLLEVIT